MGTGVISTVAGNGARGFSGDGGPATGASLNGPLGVSFDSGGDLYITDGGNARVREVNQLTGSISTVAGNGTIGYSGDGGPATAASLNAPWGVAVDPTGNLYITDIFNDRVRRVARSGCIDPGQTPEACDQKVIDIEVDLSSPQGRGSAVLRWSTTREMSLTGFNVLILDRAGHRTQLNPITIPCMSCSTGLGRDYSYVVPKHKGGRHLFVEMLCADDCPSVWGPARVILPNAPREKHSSLSRSR